MKLSKNIFEILDGGSLSSVESVSDLEETPEIPVSVFFRRPIGEFVVHDHFHIFISWEKKCLKEFQDGEGLQQLHVQEVLPPRLEGQPQEGLDRRAEGRGREEEAGGAQGIYLFMINTQ